MFLLTIHIMTRLIRLGAILVLIMTTSPTTRHSYNTRPGLESPFYKKICRRQELKNANISILYNKYILLYTVHCTQVIDLCATSKSSSVLFAVSPFLFLVLFLVFVFVLVLLLVVGRLCLVGLGDGCHGADVLDRCRSGGA